jgi:hypothetical protein
MKLLWFILLALFLVIGGVVKFAILAVGLRQQNRKHTIASLWTFPYFRQVSVFFLYATAIFLITAIHGAWSTLNWWRLFPEGVLFVAVMLAYLAAFFSVRAYYPVSFACAAFSFASLVLMHGNELLWLSAFYLVLTASFSLALLVVRDRRAL